MKILLVHNDYGKYSGEEAVVDKMASMLSALGHSVAQLRMSTSHDRESLAGNIKGCLAGFYSPAGIRAMRQALKKEKPDIVNVHNLYPYITPAALRECRKAGVPVVMTIHNFRLICPTGLFMRDNRPCELCLEKGNEWGCLKYNCEHSICKSFGYAGRGWWSRIRGHFRDCVDRYACITDFQRTKLIQAGFDPDKITVIPNSLNMPEDAAPIAGGSYVAYSGRISNEKGVDMIIEVARKHPEIEFRMAGAVRDKELVENLPANVRLMGYLHGEDLERFYREARFFIMASRWYEGFPMTILEAARYGKPMIAPDHGGFSEIIGHGDDAIGVLTTPNDPEALESAVTTLWQDADAVERLGHAAFDRLRSRFATGPVAEQWQQLLATLSSAKA